LNDDRARNQEIIIIIITDADKITKHSHIINNDDNQRTASFIIFPIFSRLQLMTVSEEEEKKKKKKYDDDDDDLHRNTKNESNRIPTHKFTSLPPSTTLI